MVKGVSKDDKKDFIKQVQKRLTRDPYSFLSVQDYNAAKNWVRRMDPKHCGRLVDNGQHFLNIMQVALERAHRPDLTRHFERLRVENRERRQLENPFSSRALAASQQKNPFMASAAKPAPLAAAKQAPPASPQREPSPLALVGSQQKNPFMASEETSEWSWSSDLLVDLPHGRPDCGVHSFANAANRIQFCSKCYCIPCDKPAKECSQWEAHCQEVKNLPTSPKTTDPFMAPSTAAKAATLASDSKPAACPKGVDVFYCKTDNTRGYKEWSFVVVKTTESMLSYYGDVYEPCPGCHYKILYEFPVARLAWLHQEVGIDRNNKSDAYATKYPVHNQALKNRVLKFWKEQK